MFVTIFYDLLLKKAIRNNLHMLKFKGAATIESQQVTLC